MTIVSYQSAYKDQIADLIIGIQQGEFNVPITLQDQPDLMNIENFYQINNGNFWCALVDDKVVGTIALIDMGAGMACIRKMFVAANYRGQEHRVAHQLHDTMQAWCAAKGIVEVYLGTLDYLHAAIRFYTKKGYQAIVPENLPSSFPRMPVDNRFFMKTF
jgi:N-acetylglutamate synthase-like GNAT family acetyltransferase